MTSSFSTVAETPLSFRSAWFDALKKRMLGILALAIILLLPSAAISQNTIVRGEIVDSKTNEPLPFVAITFSGTNTGTTTDIKGRYFLESIRPYDKISVSYLGYKSFESDIRPSQEQVLDILLEENAVDLEEVVVTAGKREYRNKENPAVALIKKVTEKKKENRIGNFDYYEYEQYEKIQFAISNVNEKFQNRKVFKNFQFLFDNLDSSKLEGRAVLPIYLKERLADRYYRKEPNSEKEILTANKAVSFEGFDNSMIDQYLQYIYQDIDIYDNDITLLTTQFLSPTSPLSPTFYRFYLGDTLMVDEVEVTELFFYPRNKSDLLFQGALHVALDGSFAIKKAELTVTDDINLNWVKEMTIILEYEKENEDYVLSTSNFSADFGLTDKSKRGVFGQRSLSRTKHVLGKVRPDDFYKPEPKDPEGDAAKLQDDDFWERRRHEELSEEEAGTYTVMDSVQQVPAFRRAMDIAALLISGYVDLDKFEFGPLNSIFSFNQVEGIRLRVGGRTSERFSEKVLLSGFLTYGLKDDRFKYSLRSLWSLNGKSLNDFPRKTLELRYSQDTQIPGQAIGFLEDDNLFLSFQRNPTDKLLYNEIGTANYYTEFENNFSIDLGLNYWKQEAGGSLEFIQLTDEGARREIESLTTSEVLVTLRWAPDEEFYQLREERIPVHNRKPVYTVRSVSGIRGMFGGQYDYQKVTGHIFKRFATAQVGYSDVAVEAGKIFGKVPYPLLTIHNANQTYSYQLQAYNLMNFLEFVSDQYVSVNVDHNFNGAIFNKIPLFKRLKWREVASAKVLFGTITDRNTPTESNGLYELPRDLNGTPITTSLEATPYIEGSVGVANVFKIFRVDLVKRFTYLDNPNVSKLGLRMRMKLDF